MEGGTKSAESDDSGPAVFSADDIVSLYYGGDAHACAAILKAPLYANHFTERTYKHFRSVCYFRGERQRNVKFGAGFQILVENKIQASRGDIARLSPLCICYTFGGDPDDHRER